MSSIYLSIQSKLQDLSAQLLQSHPNIPILLRDIHSQLKQNPEVVTLMTEDEVAIVVQGLSVQTRTHLSGSVMKSAKSATSKAAMKNVKLDDLGF